MRPDDPRSDEEPLAATADDAEAYAAFYRRHLRSVLAYLLHRTGRRDLAADLAAETFAAALQSLPRYEPLPGQGRGRLFAIASNELADSARAGTRVGRVILAVHDGDFPSGDLVLTAHLRGGGTWRQRFPLGF